MMMMHALMEVGILRGILGYLTYQEEAYLIRTSVSLKYLIRNYRSRSVCSHALIQDRPELPKPFTATCSRFAIPYTFPSASSSQIASKIYQRYSAQLLYTRRLYIKHTKTVAGFGVYSDCTIPKDSLLFFYGGECLRSQEVRERRINKTQAMNYILTINESSIISTDVTFKLHYDATFYGNLGRFVNHSCDPNCSVIILRVDSMLGLPAFVSNKIIYRGQQVTFDYGEGDSCDVVDNVISRGVDGAQNENKETKNKNKKRKMSIRKDDTGKDISSYKYNNSYDDVLVYSDSDRENERSSTSTSTSRRVKCQCKSKSCRGFIPSCLK